MPDLPVIALTFANDQAQPGCYLRKLPEEARQIQATLDRLAQAGRCELVERPFATLMQLLDLFQVVLEPERHDRNAELVHDLRQLEHLAFVQELRFVYEHAVDSIMAG